MLMKSSQRLQPFIRKPLDHKIHFAGRFGATYFITICCHQKGSNQLCREDVSMSVFKTAKIYNERRIWYLWLMLLMPDHLHALIGIDGDAVLSSVVGNFKRATTKFASVKWQRNFFDHRLRHDESFLEKAAYIRNNPVRASLVSTEEDWPYVLDRQH